MSSEAEIFNIANSLQHKGKGRPANKRYLLYQLLKTIQPTKTEIFKKKLHEKEIRDNVQFVNHGIMIHEIVLKKAKK